MSEAKRNEVDYRFDLIPPEVLLEIAKVFREGEIKYGECNWQEAGLDGHKSPINHALAHINSYQMGQPNDSKACETHLIHAIVNLMFEYFHYTHQIPD